MFAPTWPARARACDRPASPPSALLHLGRAVAGVAAERPGRGELAELVADHLLADEHGHVLAAVVDGDRVPDHLREDRGRPRPGADHPLLTARVHGLDAPHQPFLDEGALLGATTHLAPLLLPAAPAADDQRVGFL